MKLKISETLSLPDNAATQKIAFIGRTGAGKSNGACVLVERLLRAEQQVVILDPVGIWYGLRTDADGTPGFAIPIFGGLHGDIPLEPTGGALVADVIVDRGISVVLDVSQFESDADKARFATGFADRFYFRKKAAPSPVHLVLEECQEVIPQNPQKGEERMLHAFQRMWKLGRNFGIGGSLITQRPQEVSKKALNQTELVFAFQLTGPQERKAMELWLSEKGSTESLAENLPSLAVGTCYAWSPQWLKINTKITFLLRSTLNTSSTPLTGSRWAGELAKAPIDLAELQEKMKDTVERAKADDPKVLRAEIAKLRAAALVQTPRVAVLPERVEVHILTPEDRVMLNNISNDIGRAEATLRVSNTNFESIRSRLEALEASKPVRHAEQNAVNILQRRRSEPLVREDYQIAGAETGRIGNGGLRRMMIAIAQRPGINRRQLGVRAGLSSSSGSFRTYLATIRKNGWLLSDALNGEFVLSPHGTLALGAFTPLPEGEALFNYWCIELGDGGITRILRALQTSAKGLSRDDLAATSGMSSMSGSFRTYLSKLRSLELIEGREIIKLSDELR